MLNLILLQASQNLTEGVLSVDNAVKSEELTDVLLDMAGNGGPGVIPIVLLSVVGLFIFFDRFIAIHNARKVDAKLMIRLREYILDGKIESAFNLCRKENTPSSRMIEKGISRIGRSIDEVNTVIRNAGNMEVSKLEKGLPVLASVVGGAPMLGILGTVLALIQALYEMANSGKIIDMPQIASFVYQALFSTVAGFVVGIIAYFAYNILVASVSRVILHLEAATSEFLDILNEPQIDF